MKNFLRLTSFFLSLCKQFICKRVTISFALPATNREIKRTENSSDLGVRTTKGGGKLTRNSLGKRERNSSLFQGTGSATTGNSTGLKLGLQQFNLRLVNVTCTIN